MCASVGEIESASGGDREREGERERERDRATQDMVGCTRMVRRCPFYHNIHYITYFMYAVLCLLCHEICDKICHRYAGGGVAT